MTPLVKSIFLSDGSSLQNFCPEIPENFHVLALLTIGPADQKSGSDYSLGICTPRWLAHQVDKLGPTPGRHLLIVNQFNAAEILAAIGKIVEQCTSADAESAAVMLARFFAWEFEDYGN